MTTTKLRQIILVCGDRKGFDIHRIMQWVSKLPKDTVVVHGDCQGVDEQAGSAARNHELEVHSYPADWAKYGRAAGPIRNQQMLDDEQPNLVVAFHSNFEKSKGTKNMLEQADKRGIPIELHE